MQSKKANGDIPGPGTEVNIKNPLIEWYIHRFHRLVQRERRAGMIQTTRLVHHVFIERRRDLLRSTIVHRPHRSNHRMEPSKLHRRREMDRLVWTLFVSYGRMTCREIHKFGILQFALDYVSDREVSVVESERGLEWLFPVWETMTRKADPFVPAELFNDPRSARFLSIYTRECGEAGGSLTNIDKFRAYEKELALARSVGLGDGNETFPPGCRIR